MSVFDVKPNAGVRYEMPPAGSHAATLVAVVDLGTHKESYPGKPPTKSRKVFLVWELADEKTTEGKPYFLGKRFTLSIHEKSNLGALIGSWRGKALEKDEGYDVRRLAGKSCLLNVTHETSKQSGNEYAAAAGVIPLPKGMSAPKPSVKPLVWSFEDGKPFPIEDWIPYVHGTALRDVLGEAEEAKGSAQPAAASGATNGADDADVLGF